MWGGRSASKGIKEKKRGEEGTRLKNILKIKGRKKRGKNLQEKDK